MLLQREMNLEEGGAEAADQEELCVSLSLLSWALSGTQKKLFESLTWKQCRVLSGMDHSPE